MAYLWRIWWVVEDALEVLAVNLFPINLILVAVLVGCCFGYLWRVLFGEPGGAALIMAMGTKEDINEHLHLQAQEGDGPQVHAGF